MRSDKYNVEEKKEDIKEPIKKESNILKKILIIIIIVLVLLFIYSKFINPNELKINEYKIEHSLINKDYDGFKIVHISDIHYGTHINSKKLNKIVKKINELKPDIVIFTGDLFDKDIVLNEDNYNELITTLSNIEAKLYKYAIAGDEDDNEKYYSILDNSNFILLDNKYKLLFNNSEVPLVLYGFDNNNPDYSILDDEEFNSYYKIALIHKPDEYSKLSNTDLILAGHSLGGTINIINPLFKKEGSKEYYKKHYSFENKELFISYGLGTNKLGIRFNNSPSINLYRLYNK